MLRTAFKNVLAHKLRLALTALAIVLGVAFVSGTYVFTDTISARFESLFGEVFAWSLSRPRRRPRSSPCG